MWGGSEQQIIGYGDHYSYERSGGKRIHWFIVGLAAQKNDLSVYVNAADGKRYLAEAYADKLGKVKVGKSSISFKRLDDIQLDTLMELVAIARNQMS